MDVRVLVLSGFGINCEAETAEAFRRAGAEPVITHVNDLIAAPDALGRAQILAVPGGFSFGDDVASGRILANRLRFGMADSLNDFVQSGNLVIGICNGFQVLVKTGLLPMLDGTTRQDVTLTHNDSDRFEDRWVTLKRDAATRCVWVEEIDSMELPVRHGEGKFVTKDTATLEALRANGQIALRYANFQCAAANGEYPANPNGSIDDIAGICDPTGRIFGLMPHPEAYLDATNHPCWTRLGLTGAGAGQTIFENGVRAASRHPSTLTAN